MRRLGRLIELVPIITIIIVLALVARHALADGLGPYRIQVESAYDGDTFGGTVEVWPGVVVSTNVRVKGVDTAEMRSDCEREETLALLAREFTRQALGGAEVVLVDVEPDKYAGRVAARVLVNGEDLADMLIEAGLGRPYDGGGRRSWCD